jgi:integrase/recombinase XerD
MPPHALRYLPSDVDGPPPWDEACREFLDNRALLQHSPRTLEWHTYILNPFGRYLKKTLGTDAPAVVREEHVCAFLRIVGTKGLGGRPPVGAKRLNDYRESLSLFYAWLQERGYVQHNPVERVKKVREPRKLIESFSEAQVKGLLQQPNRETFVGLRDYMFMLVLLDTGLRLAEGLGLKLADLDLDDMVVKVMGKGNKERRAGLSPRLLTELKPYLRNRQAAVSKLGLPDSPWVFPNDIGGRLVSKTMQQHIKRYGEAAGIRGVRVSPHTLRHTYALNFVREGGDPFTLQKVLGHTSLEMSRRYCELADSDVLKRQRELTPLRTMGISITPGRRIPRSAMSSW